MDGAASGRVWVVVPCFNEVDVSTSTSSSASPNPSTRFSSSTMESSMAVGVAVYDTQCGAKLFRVDRALHEALEIPFFGRWSFDVELISRLTPRAAGTPGSTVVELPVHRWKDVSGSKLDAISSFRSAWSLVGVARRRRSRTQGRSG